LRHQGLPFVPCLKDVARAETGALEDPSGEAREAEVTSSGAVDLFALFLWPSLEIS
jgi:hypothetical protein